MLLYSCLQVQYPYPVAPQPVAPQPPKKKKKHGISPLNIVGEFGDDNPHLVPMKYRLECTDGTVISDEWVTLEELLLTIECLPAHSERTYHLEWVWLTESDELDTIIGSTEGAKYTIIIELISTIIE